MFIFITSIFRFPRLNDWRVAHPLQAFIDIHENNKQ